VFSPRSSDSARPRRPEEAEVFASVLGMRNSAQFELPHFEGSTLCCCEQLNKGFYALAKREQAAYESATLFESGDR
jgi:hypothetical protein